MYIYVIYIICIFDFEILKEFIITYLYLLYSVLMTSIINCVLTRVRHEGAVNKGGSREKTERK